MIAAAHVRRTVTAATVVVGLVWLALLLALGGCSKREVPLSSGKVIAGPTLPGVRGDDNYAEVSADALPAIRDGFTDTLSRLGLVKWDERFDCNHLADLYVATAQVRFAVESWHSRTQAQALAMAVVWYRDSPTSAHAIVELRTDRGVLYVDPSAGAREVAAPHPSTVFFRKW